MTMFHDKSTAPLAANKPTPPSPPHASGYVMLFIFPTVYDDSSPPDDAAWC
jgi:hypothetical protein